MYIIIVGCGKLGYYLTQDLLNKGHEVTVVEMREDRHSRAASELGTVAILGRGNDPSVLEEAGIMRADVVVAATGHDEDNLVICHVAKMLHPQVRTVARVNHPKNEGIFRRLGIDAVVNGTALFANVIEHELTMGDIVPLLSLRRSGMEIVELFVEEGAPCVGRQVQDLVLPQDCVLISIVRGDHVIVARGATDLQPGDEIVALVRATQEEELRCAFMGQGVLASAAVNNDTGAPEETKPHGLRRLFARR